MTERRRVLSLRNAAGLALSVLLLMPAAGAQTSAQSTDLQNQIDTLNETNRAILRELQAIRQLLQEQRAPQAPADALPAEPVDISREPFRGAANAKVAIIEFSDYQCPFCARFERDAYVQIGKDFVDTGKVKYVWRDLPLDMHPQARKAAEAAHCAGMQGKFWEMHDRLFTNQQALMPADLTNHATALGLNVGQFQTCLDSGRFAADVNADIAEASKMGITGTPSFLIGLVQPNGSVRIVRKVVGARPYADFKAAIESALAAN